MFLRVARPARTDRVPALLTISEAAELLGVSMPTLRRWDSAGKFTPHRHPINGYRLYKRAEVMRLKKSIERGAK
ncbi:MAG: helix-turn-helix domain-containing protein [Polyangiaceae bacterium]